jgi:hypothetical protein
MLADIFFQAEAFPLVVSNNKLALLVYFNQLQLTYSIPFEISP